MAAVMYRGYLEKGSEVLGSRAEDCFVAQKPTKKQLNVKLIKKTRKTGASSVRFVAWITMLIIFCWVSEYVEFRFTKIP
jgi:hypothetical protein